MATERSDTLERTIRFLTSNGLFEVIRTRSSNGGAAITIIDTEGNKPVLVLLCAEAGNQNYEMAARGLGEALVDAANECCLLPEDSSLSSERPAVPRKKPRVDHSVTGDGLCNIV